MESIRTCRIGIFVLVLLVMAIPAGADVRTWDSGGSDTEWATAGNWNPDGYSDSDDLTVLSGSPTSAVHVYADNGGSITLSGSSAVANFSKRLYLGYTSGTGTLNITDGGTVSNYYNSYMGDGTGTSGTAAVHGTGSKWTVGSNLWVGYRGTGTLSITGGGTVSNYIGSIGSFYSGSSGTVTVSGAGSTWTNSADLYDSASLYVGNFGTGVLNITDGGLVSVAGTLSIDLDSDGDSFINMATGGMLALHGDADDSLADFLDMIGGTAAIRYWDASASDWADITGATYGQDYTLAYLTEGDLAGYTVLTVPEPVSAVLLLSGGIMVMFRRRRKN